MPNQEPAFSWPFGNGPVRVGIQGLFCPCLKTFVEPFNRTRLTAPGSPRMRALSLSLLSSICILGNFQDGWEDFWRKGGELVCKTFDVKSRSFKIYHMQVSYAKAFYPYHVNSIKAFLIPVHWQVLGRKLQCGVCEVKTRTKRLNRWSFCKNAKQERVSSDNS